jgi:hypothetical protein
VRRERREHRSDFMGLWNPDTQGSRLDPPPVAGWPPTTGKSQFHGLGTNKSGCLRR